MSYKYSLGIALNLFDARAILLREDGKIVTQISKKKGVETANETIKVLFELFEGILAKAQKYKGSIEKVGLALGGIVNKKKEVVFWPQDSNSYVHISFPLKGHLEKKFGLPVLIENDANACAWAEHSLNFPKHKNLLYMFSGVGCGIIIDGQLYRGKNGVAGELFLNADARMTTSRLGDFSFLRQWPADLDMVKRAKELISLGRDSSLIRKITPTGQLYLEDIFAELKKKDRVAREAVREGAFCLGVKIAFLVNLLNPEAVIIGGALEQGGDFFLEECLNSIKSFSLSESRQNCKISVSGLGQQAASLGAALLALRA